MLSTLQTKGKGTALMLMQGGVQHSDVSDGGRCSSKLLLLSEPLAQFSI